MRWFAWVGSLLAVAFLSGCESGVVTNIEVISGSQAKVEVVAEFSGESAQAIFSSQALVDDLVSNMERLTGEVPVMYLSGTLVTATVSLPFDSVTSAGDITGLSSIVSKKDGDRVVLSVSFTQPTQLLQTLRNVSDGRADGDAFFAAASENTYTKLVVTFPGEATVLSSSGVEYELDGRSVTVIRGVNEGTDGSLVVSGGESGGRSLLLILLVIGSVLVVVAVMSRLLLRRV